MELSGKESEDETAQRAPADSSAENAVSATSTASTKSRLSFSQQTKLQEAAQLEADYPFLTKSVEDIVETNLVSQLLDDYKRLALADWNRRQLQFAQESHTPTKTSTSPQVDQKSEK